MTECASCHTLNPETERACLACGAALPPRARASAPTGSGTLGMTSCPAGHPVDPSWRSCPYCDRTAAAGAGNSRRTRLDGEPPPDPPVPSARSGPAPTRLEEPGRPAGRRTLLEGSAPAPEAVAPETAPPPGLQPAEAPAPVPGPPASGSSGRRLVGVLAAPEMGPGGMVFAVRAGRTTLGAGRQNDIVLPGDSEVSGEHAVILHRGSTFHLTDRLSTNGTWHNGREVPANGTIQLQDRDRIRCGRTELVFLRIEPEAAEIAETP